MDIATDHNIVTVSNNSTNCYKTKQVALSIISHHNRDDFKNEANTNKTVQQNKRCTRVEGYCLLGYDTPLIWYICTDVTENLLRR
jgi:Tfp pilus assembly ATPase PilU